MHWCSRIISIMSMLFCILPLKSHSRSFKPSQFILTITTVAFLSRLPQAVPFVVPRWMHNNPIFHFVGLKKCKKHSRMFVLWTFSTNFLGVFDWNSEFCWCLLKIVHLSHSSNQWSDNSHPLESALIHASTGIRGFAWNVWLAIDEMCGRVHQRRRFQDIFPAKFVSECTLSTLVDESH